MSDLEIFPDNSYNEDTGEYSQEFDFEPDFKSRVYLNNEQTLWVDVSGLAGSESAFLRVFELLEQEAIRGGFEPTFDKNNPDNFPAIPGDFDYNGKNTRGPFIDNDSVQNWLKKSGLRGTAKVYYDEANEEFWVDVNTN